MQTEICHTNVYCLRHLGRMVSLFPFFSDVYSLFCYNLVVETTTHRICYCLFYWIHRVYCSNNHLLSFLCRPLKLPPAGSVTPWSFSIQDYFLCCLLLINPEFGSRFLGEGEHSCLTVLLDLQTCGVLNFIKIPDL